MTRIAIFNLLFLFYGYLQMFNYQTGKDYFSADLYNVSQRCCHKILDASPLLYTKPCYIHKDFLNNSMHSLLQSFHCYCLALVFQNALNSHVIHNNSHEERIARTLYLKASRFADVTVQDILKNNDISTLLLQFRVQFSNYYN